MYVCTHNLRMFQSYCENVFVGGTCDEFITTFFGMENERLEKLDIIFQTVGNYGNEHVLCLKFLHETKGLKLDHTETYYK